MKDKILNLILKKKKRVILLTFVILLLTILLAIVGKYTQLNNKSNRSDEKKETVLGEESKNNIDNEGEDKISNEFSEGQEIEEEKPTGKGEENEIEKDFNTTQNNQSSKTQNNSDGSNSDNSSPQKEQSQIQPEDTNQGAQVPPANQLSIPEPTYGTVIIGGIQPGIDNGWAYLGIVVQDIWVGYEQSTNGWARSVRQSTLGTKGQGIDSGEALNIAIRQYPLRTDVGTDGQVVEYNWIWVYCGAGRY